MTRISGIGSTPAVFRRMRHRIAHLHRAGVRAQVQPRTFGVLQVDIEGVLHRARRVVLRAVERREVHPVGLDLGALGDVETHRGEDGLDALDRAADRVQAAGAAATAGQRDVQRLGAQLRLQFGSASDSRRACSAASMRALSWLISAPRDFFCSGGSVARPLSRSVTRPLLPRKRALAFSSSAGVGAASNSACAALTS
jgi:hypothetical protein